jgi:hypothetical protein
MLISKLQKVSQRNGYLSVGCLKVQYETCGPEGVYCHDHFLLEVTPFSLLDRDDGATSDSKMLVSIYQTTRRHISKYRNVKCRLL